MKLHFRDKRLAIVFEPHTFGWRNRANLHWYDSVFKGASTVFVLPPDMQGAATHAQVTQADIMARIGEAALPYESPEDVLRALSGNEIVLILTSGSLQNTLPKLTEAITKAFPI